MTTKKNQNPCDDFENYVNRGWRKRTPIPHDFTHIYYHHKIMSDNKKNVNEKINNHNLISQLHNQESKFLGLDMNSTNIYDIIERNNIDIFATKLVSPIRMYMRNEKKYIEPNKSLLLRLVINNTNFVIGMPKNRYNNKNELVYMKEYKQFIRDMIGITKLTENSNADDIIYNFEREIANITLEQYMTKKVITYTELQTYNITKPVANQSFKWDIFFNDKKYNGVEMILCCPEYFNILHKNYEHSNIIILWQTLLNIIPFCRCSIYNCFEKFYTKIGIPLNSQIFSFGIVKYFCSKIINKMSYENIKTERFDNAKNIIDNIVKTLVILVQKNKEIKEVKGNIIEKIKSITFRFGHVDDQDEIIRLGKDYFTSMVNMTNDNIYSHEERLYYETSYYDRYDNTIRISYKHLHDIMFGSDSIGCKYGGFGSLIGHELMHAFCHFIRIHDDTYKSFIKRTHKLKKQFSQYLFGDDYVDGSASFDENVADLGGVELAFATLSRICDDKSEHTKFFRQYARRHRFKYKQEERFYKKYINSKHSPNKYRVNGIVQHIDSFYSLFNVSEKDGMYIKEPDRVKIF